MIKNTHPEWGDYEKWLKEQIATAHEAMENVQLTPTEIAALQGEIRAYRNIIKAADVQIMKDTSTTDYN